MRFEWPAYLLTDLSHLVADLFGAEHPAGQRTKRTTLHYRDAQFNAASSGHRRLDDGTLDPDEIEEPAVAPAYHSPVLAMDDHGSAGASAAPFWSSSTEMLSGVRTNAMRPSRGGRLMVTPASISRSHVP